MKFGGNHTRIKLEVLAEYCQFYTRVLKNQHFRLIYIDAFAGTGDMVIDDRTEPDLFGVGSAQSFEGSVRRALKLPFHEFWIAELNKKRFNKLTENLNELPEPTKSQIRLRCGDSDEILMDWAAELERDRDGRANRAVVFLDPFGMSISFETLRRLGATKRVDVWFLVPTQIGIARHAPRNNRAMKERWAPKLTRMLGTDAWKKEWYTAHPPLDLGDGAPATEFRQANLEDIEKFTLERLNLALNKGAFPETLPLGPRNTRWYTLTFACSNPSAAARKLAFSAAQHIIRKSR